MPMLGVTRRRCPLSSCTGSTLASRIFLAMASAARASGRSESTTTNSSPPMRATRSPPRTARLSRPVGMPDGVLQPFLQQRAVGQLGQLVVVGDVQDAVAGLVALGDVAQHAHELP